MHPVPHIAVVGAGIAGLSCATALQHAGFQVSIVDKSRGPGGRMSTRRDADWQCDHGAPFFTASGSEFRAEVERWQQAGVAGVWTPRWPIADGQALRGASVKDGQPATEERLVGSPRMTAPARFLANPLSLTTQLTIRSLRRDVHGWQMEAAEATAIHGPFAAVVLAIPAPQALPLLAAHSAVLSALAAGARMRPCWALMLRYDAALDFEFDAALMTRGPLRWLARDRSKPGRSGAEAWLLHASADWSEANLDQSAEFVAARLLAAFADLGARAPQAWLAHRWRYANAEPALNAECGWDAGSAIGLCGDWLNGGNVEGAWLSGCRLAGKIAAAHGVTADLTAKP